MISGKSIDNNLRLSKITEEKLNISVDGISSSRGNSVINQLNENVGGFSSDDERLHIKGNNQKSIGNAGSDKN